MLFQALENQSLRDHGDPDVISQFPGKVNRRMLQSWEKGREMDSTAEKEEEPNDVAFTEVDLREHDKDSKILWCFLSRFLAHLPGHPGLFIYSGPSAAFERELVSIHV